MHFFNWGVVLVSVMIFSNSFATTQCETHREQHLDKQDVRVWSTTVCPKQRLAFHTHQHARVAISQETGDLDVIYQDGRKGKIHFEKNVPVYLSATQGRTPHQDVNSGSLPLHITVIEIMD